jgi:hypothetical protein
MHQLFLHFFDRPNQFCSREARFSHTHSNEYDLPFLQKNEHNYAHLLVVYLTQALQRISIIGVSEISAMIVIRLRRANDSPVRDKLFPVQCTTFS